MPYTLPAAGIRLLRTNFADTITSFVNSLESTITSLQSTVNGHTTSIAAKYTKPSAGIPLTDLSATALAGLVQTDGTVLRAVKLTQAQYDALGTKVATTLYIVTDA